MLRLVLSAALICAVTCALPPISQENRVAWSSHIVVARVLSVSSSMVEKQPHFIDAVWTLELEVEEFEKGEHDGETRLAVRLWKMHERPPGWTGDSGQRGEVPAAGDKIRAFVSLNDEGVFEVLKPNGIDRIGHKKTESVPETPTALITRLIAEHKIVVFSKSYCPYSSKAKNAFRELQQMTGRGTVPNVFINRQSIGGGDDTQRMLKSGELRRLVDA